MSTIINVNIIIKSIEMWTINQCESFIYINTHINCVQTSANYPVTFKIKKPLKV